MNLDSQANELRFISKSKYRRKECINSQKDANANKKRTETSIRKGILIGRNL